MTDETLDEANDLLVVPLPFSVVAIEGKGYGCVADRAIAVGERLCAEAPILRVGPGLPPLERSVYALSSANRKKFFGLTQNTARFGDTPTAEGTFATNAHPCHEFAMVRGIFPTVARINHACDNNACYRWNANLDRLTVHAIRPIAAGDEICVSYSYSGSSRSQRQKHLRDTFGFTCACTKCELVGAALYESELRLKQIGDVTECVRDLCAGGELLRDVAKRDTTAFLNQLEGRYELIQAEFPDGHADGVEHYLQAFVELCERCAAKLTRLLAQAQAAEEAVPAPAAVACASAQSKATQPPCQPITACQPTPHSEPAEPAFLGSSSAGGPAGSPAASLRAKLKAYLGAARQWAALSRDVTRAIKGDDSPAFELWTTAIDEGLWNDDDQEAGRLRLERPFYVRAVKAGFQRNPYCHRLLV